MRGAAAAAAVVVFVFFAIVDVVSFAGPVVEAEGEQGEEDRQWQGGRGSTFAKGGRGWEEGHG